MKNSEMMFELAAQILNDPALAAKLDQINPGLLRRRILALAELNLLKDITEGNLENTRIRELIQIIKPLALLEIREKDLAERRAMTERVRQTDLEEKQSKKSPPPKQELPAEQEVQTQAEHPVNRANHPNPPLRQPTPQTPPPNRPCPGDPAPPTIGGIR